MSTSKTLSPSFRVILDAWPQGEKRTHNGWRFLKIGNGSTSDGEWVSSGQLGAAVDRGFLTVESRARTRGSNVTGREERDFTRTDKPVKLYVPHGPRADYEGPFPWGVQEHWKRMESSQVRTPRAIAEKLEGGRRYDSVDFEMVFQLPRVVQTRTELDHVRKALLQFFGGTVRHHHWWIPTPLKYLFVTGEGLHLLFMDMLVRPVFEGDEFVKFEAVDPAEARQEIEHLTLGTGNVKEKYREYLIRSEVFV